MQGHPGPLYWMYSQEPQGMHRTGGTGKVKKSQEEVQVPGMKGGIQVAQFRSHQGVIKIRMVFNTLSSPTREHKLVHFPNPSGSSQLCCLGKSSVSQMNHHFFFFSHNVCCVMVFTLIVLSYVSFVLMFQL